MQTKYLIFNADDFGMSKEANLAVLKGFSEGFLTSACVTANGEAFEEAMNNVVPDCAGLGLGVHLNIVEGRALTDCPLLCDSSGEFDKGFLYILLNSKKKDFLKQIENEFRAQIERVLEYKKPDHLNSHVHVHAIPEVFKLTVKLALEYEIPFVRTQHELLYITPKAKKIFSLNFLINLIKVGVLNFFTAKNRLFALESGLQTNDFIIGVGYTGFMDSDTILYGLKSIAGRHGVFEILIHPSFAQEWVEASAENPSRYGEFLATQDKILLESVEKQGFLLTNYKNMA